MDKKIFLPKGKALVKVLPKAESVNGFYIPESNRNENQNAELLRISIGEDCPEECVAGLKNCIIRKDAGVQVDVSAVFDETDSEAVYKVVDVQNDILIIY